MLSFTPGCDLGSFELTFTHNIFSCRWPKSGCCSWDDSHSYETKHRSQTSGRVFIPRGILARTIPCPVFSVMDVFSALWRPVAPVGLNKMVALLFWTKWSVSFVVVCLFKGFRSLAEDLTVKRIVT